MKKWKRGLAALLAAAALVVPAAAADDLTGHWSEPYIRTLAAHGVVNANGNGEYTPNAAIARAEFMRYINRAYGLTETADVSAYTDVKSGQWYYETVQIAVQYGYITGVTETTMGPTSLLTREQVVTLLGRMGKVEPEPVLPSALPFTDRTAISSWSAPYIARALDRGQISGYADNTFRPRGTITRAEALKILYNTVGTILDQSGGVYTGDDLLTDTPNVLITAPCTLRDAEIEGDLYLSEGLAQGAVVLENVTVGGNLIAAGGTVRLEDVEADLLHVESPFPTRSVNLVAAGDTSIGETAVQTTASLTWQGGGGDGFGAVAVEGTDTTPVTLDGAFDEVTVSRGGRLVLAAGATVEHLASPTGGTVIGG